jgi:hypothetical protein
MESVEDMMVVDVDEEDGRWREDGEWLRDLGEGENTEVRVSTAQQIYSIYVS